MENSVKRVCKRWSEDEKRKLFSTANGEWDWVFPGWYWVSEHLLRKYGYKRTPESCRKMYSSLLKGGNYGN